jgi:hypothetical protein
MKETVMRQQSNRGAAFIAIGAVFIVIGVSGHRTAFFALGATFIVTGLVFLARQRSK